MKLYKNKHAQGAIWVKRRGGGVWTSKECRDYCARNRQCLAVDYVGHEKTCLMHKKKFTRITVTASYTGQKKFWTVSQYAKECGIRH